MILVWVPVIIQLSEHFWEERIVLPSSLIVTNSRSSNRRGRKLFAEEEGWIFMSNFYQLEDSSLMSIISGKSI